MLLLLCIEKNQPCDEKMYRLASIRLSDVLPITNVYNIPIPRYVQFKMAIYNVTMCNDWWLGLQDSYIIVTVFCSFFWQRFQVASESWRKSGSIDNAARCCDRKVTKIEILICDCLPRFEWQRLKFASPKTNTYDTQFVSI